MKSLVALALLALVGCGAPEAGPSVNKGAESADDDDDTTAEDAKEPTTKVPATTPLPAPVAGPELSFHTALAKTGARNPSALVRTKDKANCTEQWFEKLRIDVTTDAAGQTKSFRLSADWKEKDGACQGVTANPSGTIALAFDTATPLDQPMSLQAAGTVKVEASADVAIDVNKKIGRVTLRFHRTDANAPNDWQFNEQYALAAD